MAAETFGDGGGTIGPDVGATLQLVVDVITRTLGFDVAAINVVDDEDARFLVVAAVSGPPEVHDALLHRRQGREGWDLLFEESEALGRLRFRDHRLGTADPHDVFSWVPDLPVSEDPEAWHPEDSLFAALEGSDGSLIGTLSVDVPRGGRRPDATTLQALEALAVTAPLALEHARFAATVAFSSRRFEAIFEQSPVPIGVLDPDRRITSVNAAFCRFLHRSRRELMGQDPVVFTHPDDAEASAAFTEQVRRGRPSTQPLEKRYVLPDGAVVWGRLHLAHLGGDGEVIAQVEDVTGHKRSERQLLRLAHHDSLTGLPNRAQSMRALRTALDVDAESGAMTAVFFGDLDRLKLVNDAHGHAVGDTYIKEIARRLTAAVRDGDTVGRLGGDEFLIVVGGLGSPAEAIGLAGRVVDAVHRPLRVGKRYFTPSLSLGIAYTPGGSGASATELVSQADAAMYRAKVEHRGGWQVHDTRVANTAGSQLALRADVAAAIEGDQLELHYQPIVRLSDRSLVGHEALLRWRHPTRGLLLPGQFLDVILDSEYESPVTDWSIAKACHDVAGLGGRVNVNVSSVQVSRRDLPDVVARALRDGGLEPARLVLELTEDRLLSRADGEELLDRLRALGVGIAIDDFGSGYAGLQYLQRFPSMTMIKLDRSFLERSGDHAVSAEIVRSVVELAHRCGLSIVTEGVETAEQAEFVTAVGADYAQGWFFGRPAPLDQVSVSADQV